MEMEATYGYLHRLQHSPAPYERAGVQDVMTSQEVYETQARQGQEEGYRVSGVWRARNAYWRVDCCPHHRALNVEVHERRLRVQHDGFAHTGCLLRSPNRQGMIGGESGYVVHYPAT